MAENEIVCAVVSPDQTLRARLSRLASESGRNLSMLPEIGLSIGEFDVPSAERLRDSDARVIVLDLGQEPLAGLKLARYLADGHGGRTFVLVGPQVEADVLLEAMRIGAAEYVPRPVDEAELTAAVARAVRRVGNAPASGRPNLGRVYAVYSPKGGTGVTTAAVNLAVELQEIGAGPTLLLDLDLDLGGCSLLLGLQPRYSIFDVVKNLHRLDQNLLESFVERHEATGVQVLGSPAQANAAELLSKEQIRSAIQFLRRAYGSIVVDLARTLTQPTQAALEVADEIVVLATPDLPTLRNTKRTLPLVERAASIGGGRIRMVMNRVRGTELIAPEDVEKALGQEVFHTLHADDERLEASANEGSPAVLQTRSRYAREIRELAAAITNRPHANGRKAAGVQALLRPFRRGEKK